MGSQVVVRPADFSYVSSYVSSGSVFRLAVQFDLVSLPFCGGVESSTRRMGGHIMCRLVALILCYLARRGLSMQKNGRDALAISSVNQSFRRVHAFGEHGRGPSGLGVSASGRSSDGIDTITKPNVCHGLRVLPPPPF